MVRGILGVAIGSAVALTSTIANADGMPRQGVVVAPPPPPFTWTGLYLGLHTGWQSTQIEGSDFTNVFGGNPLGTGVSRFFTDAVNSTGAPSRQDADGWVFGGQVGYNHQFQYVVLGTELSATWANVDDTSSGAGNDNRGCFQAQQGVVRAGQTLTRNCHVEQDWSVQWLGKLGVAYGRTLLYATGGVAITRLDFDRRVNFTAVGGAVGGGLGVVDNRWSGDSTHVGVVLGAGLQYAITDNLSLGVEYLHTEYASADAHTTGTFVNNFPGTAGTFAANSNMTNNLDTDTVRAVLNYKFNCCGGGW